MKRIIISGFVSVILLGMGLSTHAKSKLTQIYVFGFAASFNDSTVYFTEIQKMDSAWVSQKNGFLVGRDNYSSQLRDYLTSQGKEQRTCITVYAKSQKEIQKKYDKLVELYVKGKKRGSIIYDAKFLTTEKFSYHNVAWNKDIDETTKREKPTKSKKKK